MKLDLQLFGASVNITGSDVDTNIASNTSYITGTITISTNGPTYNNSGSAYYTINGGGANYFKIGQNSTFKASYRLGPYGHSANGSLPNQIVSVYVHLTSNTSTSNSISVPMQTIPRWATITGAENFTDEGNPLITYTNPAGNSVSSLQACISLIGTYDDIKYRDILKTGTSYRFNLTDDERNLLKNATPNNNNLNVIFSVKTIIGGQTYYSKLNRTMTIVNANPTFTTFNFEDTNTTTIALTGDNQSIIKGYSNVKITIPVANKAIANKYATMKSYSFNDIKADYSDTEDVSITANKVNSGTINVLAIDSRGNVTTASKVATNTIDYTPIKLTNLSLSRESGVSGNVTMNFSGTWWNGNFGKVTNSIKSITYKIHNNETNKDSVGTTTLTPTIKDNNFSFNGAVAGDNEDTKEFDPSASYNVTVTVTDELGISSMTYILGTGIPAISIDRSGVGIFCKYDSSIGGYLQVNGQKIA